MTNQEWHDYWHDYIKRYYQNPEAYEAPEVPEPSDIRPGATEEEIQISEKECGIVFPASYRTFLKVTNGMEFSHTTRVIWLVPGTPPDRFKKVDPGAFQCFREIALDEIEEMKKNNWSCPEEFYQFCYDRNSLVIDYNKNPKEDVVKEWAANNEDPEDPYNTWTDDLAHGILPINRMQFDAPYYDDLIYIGCMEEAGDHYFINPNVRTSKDEFEIFYIAAGSEGRQFNRLLNFQELMEAFLLPGFF